MEKLTEKQRLEKQIEDAKLALQLLEKEEKKSLKENVIKSLDEYTTEEKVLFFDNMYNSALRDLKDCEQIGFRDEDSAEYAWEIYIEILAREKKSFWKYWNSLSK